MLFLHGFDTFSDMFDTCFRKHVILLAHVQKTCFYLGFVHIINNMRNATLVFTCFTIVFTCSINNSFYVNVVHMIYIMRSFALVVAHVVPCLMHVSDNM